MRAARLWNMPPKPALIPSMVRPTFEARSYRFTNGECRSTVELLPTSRRKSPSYSPSSFMCTAGTVPASVNGMPVAEPVYRNVPESYRVTTRAS